MGRVKVGRYGVRWHAQNLTDHKRGPMWCAGRAWLNVWEGNGDTGEGYREVFSLNPEWHFGWRGSFGLGLNVGDGDSDREVMAHADLGLARFYLTFDGIPRRVADRILPGYWFPSGGPYGSSHHFSQPAPGRIKMNQPVEIAVRWHSGGLWWGFWHTIHEWKSTTPKWRAGHFNPVDWLLGRDVYSSEDIQTVKATVPMPEGTYPATIRLFRSTWKRPRWPFTRELLRAEVEVEGGIPFPGKGENSWDCGEDATYSITTHARTVEAAIAAMVEAVLRNRRRYGGSVDWRPSERAA